MDDTQNQIIDQIESVFLSAGFEIAVNRPTIDEINSPCQLVLIDYDYDLDKLGSYFPKEERIEIYSDCIRVIADTLAVDFKVLKTIVFIHEIGHWITHKLPFNKTFWEAYTVDNTKPELTNVHEGWAQLITWRAIENNNNLKKVFLVLNEKQSDAYKIWKSFINSPVQSLAVIREFTEPNIKNWKDADERISKDSNIKIGDLIHDMRGEITSQNFGF